jgi:hypothetical protein
MLNEGAEHGQMIRFALRHNRSGLIEVKKVGHGRGHHSFWNPGVFQQVPFEHRCGLRKTVGQSTSQLKLPERQSPAMLPVKCETAEQENGRENPEKPSIGNAMQSGQERGMARSTTSRQGALNKLKSSSAGRLLRGNRLGLWNRDHG